MPTPDKCCCSRFSHHQSCTLTIDPILKGIPKLTLPLQYTTNEATSFQPIIKEEEEIVDISDSEDDFEVFNLPSSLGISAGDLYLLPLVQVSHSQEEPTTLEEMPIQCKTR